MEYYECLKLVDENFNEQGYSPNMMKSKSLFKYILKSKYGLAECTGDWPITFYPKEEDFKATDWEIVNSTAE